MDEREQTMTDEEIEQELEDAIQDEEAEEVRPLEDAEEEEEEQEQEEGEDEEAQEEEEAEEEETEHRARDEPKESEEAKFAKRIRMTYPGMTDEQIFETLLEAQAQKMHEEDAEISVKAAKMILKARQGAAEPVKPGKTQQEGHVEKLKEQAQRMAQTPEGARMLKDMLEDGTVRERIDAGEWDVEQARAYYEGKREAQKGKAPATLKTRTTRGRGERNFAKMTDREFDEADERISRALEEGYRVSL